MTGAPLKITCTSGKQVSSSRRSQSDRPNHTLVGGCLVCVLQHQLELLILDRFPSILCHNSSVLCLPSKLSTTPEFVTFLHFTQGFGGSWVLPSGLSGHLFSHCKSGIGRRILPLSKWSDKYWV